MGASASLILPPRISNDEFKNMGGNVYSDEFFRELRGEDNCIDRIELSDFALSISDIYMCYDREKDELGRDTHERIVNIKEALENRGFTCRLNEEESVATTIKRKLEENVKKSRAVCVFITQSYGQRVRGKSIASDRDSCRYEFLYAGKTKGSAKMMAVVLEPASVELTSWRRPLTDYLDGRPCVDMSQVSGSCSTGEEFERGVDSIEDTLLDMLKCPVKKMIENLITELSPVSMDLILGAGSEEISASHSQPCDQHEATLSGHMLGVRCMLVDGNRVFTGSADFKVHMWNATSRRVVNTFNHGSSVSCMALSRGGELLFTGSKSHRTLKVWDLNSGSLIKTIHGRAPFCLMAAGDALFGGHSKCLVVWSSEGLDERLVLTGREGSVFCMVTMGNKVFAGATGNDIRMLDLPHLSPAATLSGHTGTVNDLALSDRRLFSASADNTIRVWDVLTLEPLRTLTGHSGAVLKLLIQGLVMYSSSSDWTVRVWNIRDLTETNVLTGHTDAVWCMAFTQDHHLWTGSDDYTVKVWRRSSEESSQYSADSPIRAQLAPDEAESTALMNTDSESIHNCFDIPD